MTDFVATPSGRSPWARALTLALASGCTTAALAGRPLQAEDAGVLDPGSCEIEAYTASERGGDGTARERALQAGCGIGLRSQVALAGARSRSGDESASGLQLGGKTRLWATGGKAAPEDAAMLALAYAVGWGRDVNKAWRHSETTVNLVYSTPLGGAAGAPLTLHANLGHAREETGPVRRSTTWALALEHAGFGPVAPMAEVFGDDRDGAWWNLGVRATLLPDKAYVDFSYGRKLGSASERLITLGLKVAFGGP